MKRLSFGKCVDVFNVIRAQKGEDLWVNEITRTVTKTTGSKDEPAIKKAINHLETALLIQTKRVNKQKEIKIITLLGQEVSNFIDDLEKCRNSYARLKAAIIENNITIGDTEDSEEIRRIVQSKLLTKGWPRDDIPYFDFIMRSAFGMEMIYRNNIINSILHRYSVITGDHVVNKVADKIIQKIMMDEIQSLFTLTRDLEQISSGFTKHYFNPEKSWYTDIPFVDLFDLIFEKVEDYYHQEPNLMNKSISDTIEEVTLSLLLLLQPDDEYIGESIKSLGIRKNEQEEKILSMIKKGSISPESHLIETLSLIKLRNIYRRYLDIEHKFINKLEEVEKKTSN